MNKTELVKSVAEKVELSQKEAAVATQAVLDTITNALANGEKVQLSDLEHLKFVNALLVQVVTHKQVRRCKLQQQKYLLSKLGKN
jgi:uncharacterized protein (DUF2267 family)